MFKTTTAAPEHPEQREPSRRRSLDPKPGRRPVPPAATVEEYRDRAPTVPTAEELEARLRSQRLCAAENEPLTECRAEFAPAHALPRRVGREPRASGGSDEPPSSVEADTGSSPDSSPNSPLDHDQSQPSPQRGHLASNTEPTIVLAEDCPVQERDSSQAPAPATLERAPAAHAGSSNPSRRSATEKPASPRLDHGLRAALIVGSLAVVAGAATTLGLLASDSQPSYGADVAETVRASETALATPESIPAKLAAADDERAASVASTPSAAPSASEQAAQAALPWVDDSLGNTPCVPEQQQAERVNPNNEGQARQAHRHGLGLLMRGDLTKSVRALCRAAALNPKDAGVALDVGRVALMARDAQAAARWAERALSLAPAHRGAHELLADALAWQGQVEAATILWLQIHKLSDSDKKTRNTLKRGALLDARAALKTGDYPRAERYLRRALVFDQQDPAIMTMIAKTLLRQKLARAAARWIESATNLEPDDSQRQLLAGDIHESLNDPRRARRHYARALELEPNNAMARRKLSENPG